MKEYMKIGELAKAAGVAVSTVRYYCQIGLLSPDAKTGSGYALFGTEQLDRLNQIVYWRKQKRYTIQEIRDMLRELETESIRGLVK